MPQGLEKSVKWKTWNKRKPTKPFVLVMTVNSRSCSSYGGFDFIHRFVLGILNQPLMYWIQRWVMYWIQRWFRFKNFLQHKHSKSSFWLIYWINSNQFVHRLDLEVVASPISSIKLDFNFFPAFRVALNFHLFQFHKLIESNLWMELEAKHQSSYFLQNVLLLARNTNRDTFPSNSKLWTYAKFGVLGIRCENVF